MSQGSRGSVQGTAGSDSSVLLRSGLSLFAEALARDKNVNSLGEFENADLGIVLGEIGQRRICAGWNFPNGSVRERDAALPGCVGYFRFRSTNTISARAARQYFDLGKIL